MEENVNLNKILALALNYCKRLRNEFVMPEHVLMALLNYRPFIEALYTVGCNVEDMYKELNEYMETVEVVPENVEYNPDASALFGQMLEIATTQVEQSEAERVDIPHLTIGLLNLEDSEATYLLKKYLGDNVGDFLSLLISSHPSQQESDKPEEQPKETWKSLVTCMNDIADTFTPLIGRDEEMERTIQVLCRKDKNNPLHVGEPGVGKTALVRGLVAKIVKGDVPEKLKGCHVYQMEHDARRNAVQRRFREKNEARHGRNKRRRQRHCLHRRDSQHDGCRTWKRRSARRLEHAEALYGEQQHTFHRLHHLRRVQPAHGAEPWHRAEVPTD